MKQSLSDLPQFRPQRLEDAIAILATAGEPVHICAAGTQWPRLSNGQGNLGGIVLNILGIRGLDTFEEQADHWMLGATMTLKALQDWALSDLAVPAIRMALTHSQAQGESTLGGQIMVAESENPLLAALLVAETKVVLRSDEGQRKVPLYAFYTGINKTIVRESELLCGIEIPKPVEKGTLFFRCWSLPKGPDGRQRHCTLVSRFLCPTESLGQDAQPCRRLRLAFTAPGYIPQRLFGMEKHFETLPVGAKSFSEVAVALQGEIGLFERPSPKGFPVDKVLKDLFEEFYWQLRRRSEGV